MEVSVDYSKCREKGTTFTSENGGELKYDKANNTCTVRLEIPHEMKGGVFLYYKLTNFYQNHRWYVKSLDRQQLLGKRVLKEQLEGGDCSSMAMDGDKIIYPCGLIANSFFNDTFGSLKGQETFEWTTTGIAWPSDKDKFGEATEYALNEIVPPPNWRRRVGDVWGQQPNLKNDEHFQVWMRTAGLPTFRKLWGRNDKDTLKVGKYEIVIEDNYDVKSFEGTKSIVISTVTAIGGKNPFLGISYIVVGTLCIGLGIAFLVKHMVHPRKLGDPSYLSWNDGQETVGLMGADSVPMERFQ